MWPNLTYWALKPFFSSFIVSKAWTTVVIINSNFFNDHKLLLDKLCEERLFVGSHFEKLQVRNVVLIKEPFNPVNLKSTFYSQGSFDIVRLYRNICRKVQGSYTCDCFVSMFRKLFWCVNYAFPRHNITIDAVFWSFSNTVHGFFAVVSFFITPHDF